MDNSIIDSCKEQGAEAKSYGTKADTPILKHIQDTIVNLVNYDVIFPIHLFYTCSIFLYLFLVFFAIISRITRISESVRSATTP